MKQELRRLAFAVEATRYRNVDRADLEALRRELQDDLGQQLNHVLSELLTEFNDRWHSNEARVQEQLDEISGRVVVAGATAGQRVDAAERQMATLAASTEVLRAELDDRITAGLAGVRDRLDDLSARIDAAPWMERVEWAERLTAQLADSIEATRAELVTEIDARITALAHETASLGASMDAIRGELLAETEARMGGVRERLDDLAGQVLNAPSHERVEATERQTARLALAVDAFRAQLAAQIADVERRASAERTAAAEREIARLTELTDAIRGDLAAQIADVHMQLADRLATAKAELTDLGQSLDAHRAMSVRPAELEAVRTEVLAQAEGTATRTDAKLGARLDDLAGRVAAADASERMAAVEQQRLRELLEAHRAESVMGQELLSLRTELEAAFGAQLEKLRSELAAVHDEVAAIEAPGAGVTLRQLWRRRQHP